MKRRVTDRHDRPVTNSKQNKRGALGGWRAKDSKVARVRRNDS
jgi:hypothetical protein